MDLLAPQAVLSGIAAGSVYGLVGVGFSVSFRTTGVINIATGDLVAMGAYLTFWGLSVGLPLPVAIVVAALIVGLGMGIVERLALRPLYRFGTVYAIMSTIGLSVALQSLIQLVWGPVALVIPRLVPGEAFTILGFRLSLAQIFNLVLALVLILGMVLLLERTKIGRGMQTVARDRELASLLGIRPSQLFFLAFALAGVLAAVAGALIGPDQGLTPTMGLPLGIAGFTAAVIGGLGSPLGALAGGMVLAVAQNLAVLYLTPDYKAALAYGLLVLVLLVRPQGLFGEAGALARRV